MHAGRLLHARARLQFAGRLQPDGALLNPEVIRDYRLERRERLPDLDYDRLLEVIEALLPWATLSDPFRFSAYGTGRWPEQGWKLHVAATGRNAFEVAQRCIPLLVAKGVRFKVVARTPDLLRLNGGEFGRSQVGKFITIYPSSDSEAVELAGNLDRVTQGLAGPDVPSDRPLRRGSLIHYRYGAFRAVSLAPGQSEMIADPAGRLAPDARQPFYDPPEWATDPFVSAGVAATDGPQSGAFLGRFVVTRALSRSVWGRVYEVIDLDATPPARRVLKQVWHDVALDEFGRDSSDHAALEASVLAGLPDEGPLHGLVDVLVDDRDTFLVLEFIDGWPIGDLSGGGPAMGEWTADAVVELASRLAAALRWLHDFGVVHRDIKPDNILITPAGELRLVDAAFAYRPSVDVGPPLGFGTPGFIDPARDHGSPAPLDDVYGWAATVLLAATGTVPGSGSRPRSLRGRRPDLPRSLVTAVDRTLSDHRLRPRDFRELGFWSTARRARTRVDIRSSRAASSTAEPAAPIRVDWRRAALDAARILGSRAVATEDGVAWPYVVEGEGDTRWPASIYAGAAGIGLGLSSVAQVLGDSSSYDLATRAARELCGPMWGHGTSNGGLHAGEAGVGLFLLRHAIGPGPSHLIDMAIARGRRLAAPTPGAYDLVDGSAGTLLFLVELARETRMDEFAASADAIARRLVREAEQHSSGGGLFWRVRGLSPTERIPYLGLLHGTAGIGLALLRAGQFLERVDLVQGAQRAADLLLATATLEVGPDGEAATWPRSLDDARNIQTAHCHGAGGIGQFLIRLWAETEGAQYLRFARAAGRTVEARAYRGPSMCHGSLGDASLLTDLFQATGDSGCLAAAEAAALRGCTELIRTGIVMTTEPGLMLGVAGAAAIALRMVDPGTRQDLLLGPIK